MISFNITGLLVVHLSLTLPYFKKQFMCMYVHHRHAEVCGGQKMDPLELELRVAVSCNVGAGNLTQVLWRSSQCS